MTHNKTIINIGRQFGSGGKLIARAIGTKLGIETYDNELISKAAEESGFSKDLFLKSDENRSLFSISSFFASGKYGITENYVGDNELFRIQSEVIRDLAGKTSAVFVGRCSDYILRDMNCLDVFITAPMEERIKRVAERSGLPESDIESLIRKKDRTRETYYNYFTFGNWGVASNYDICIDSSILGIEKTADFIIDFGIRSGLVRK
ncbi:MAG: cytidylate kinase-like family protein [Bacteroidales bacterium]|jgi:cytidylate kinase|nr:cytidylate kinase-like family protein [Bacteroidales bacterium]MCI1785410.1 cytidylate kinase-like family protein [Bacteroidales bacterium]